MPVALRSQVSATLGAYMIRIGDFSRLARVSVVTLRHYDDLGLLTPARVDPETGYRYYTPDQLPRLNRILALKELGFSLEQVARLLSAELPAAQIRGMLVLQRAQLEQQVREQRARLAAVEARLQHIEREGAPLAYDVVVRPVEPQLVASIRRRVPGPEAIERLFEEVEAYAARHHVRAPHPPLTLFHDAEYREQDLDVEVAVPLSSRAPDCAPVGVHELPAVPHMACVVHAGSYATIGQAFDDLLGWVGTQGYHAAGSHREVYLRFGAGGLKLALPEAYLTDETDAYVTELQVPVERDA
jgi:DNA-binding transcriptional MerR regulator